MWRKHLPIGADAAFFIEIANGDIVEVIQRIKVENLTGTSSVSR